MTTITQTISSLGDVPSTSSPATFDARSDLLLGTTLPNMRTEMNTWAGQANTVAGEVNANAISAAASAGGASAQVVLAADQVAAATAQASIAQNIANYKGLWSGLSGGINIPASVYHLNNFWLLTQNVADVTAEVPGTSTKWVKLSKTINLSDWSGALNSAISAIGSTPTTLIIDQAATLSANLTVPATCHLEKTGPGLISGAYTLTINGGLGGDMTSPWFDANVTTGVIPSLRVVTPQIFGAMGDGSTDDTVAIQKAINALGVGALLDGGGLTYAVKNLWLKSDMRMENFNLFEMSGGVLDFSPINLGNDLQTADGSHNSAEGVAAYQASRYSPGIHDVTLTNIHIDGNRTNQTKVDYNTETGVVRDGGRHGFVSKGFITDIKFINCSARYCATDGVLLYRGLHATTVTETNQAITRVTFEGCTFEWNRRHGGAAESVNYGTWENCKLRYNGRTINGGAVIGDVGAKVGANLYGNGWDMEGYSHGSKVSNIRFINCDLLENIRDGLLFMDVTDQSISDFSARTDILIQGCHLDTGIDNNNGEYALTFTSAIGTKSHGPMYIDVQIVNCILEGMITLRATDSVRVSGCVQRIPTATSKIVMDYATNTVWKNNKSNGTGFTQSNSSLDEDTAYYASTTWNPGAIAANTKVYTTVSLAGVSVGMFTLAGLTSLSTAVNAGLILSSFVVFSNDGIVVTLTNPTAAELTVGSGTLSVKASKF